MSFILQIPHEGLQIDLQKQIMSGVNSPSTLSSPVVERSELVFPSLPPQQQQQSVQQQPIQQQAIVQETSKGTLKISQLSELDQQLSKLHNQRPVLQQLQQQPIAPLTQTYSDAVRQSPTTVQPQFFQTIQQAPNQMPGNSSAQQTLGVQGDQGMVRKISRFQVNPVAEELKQQQQQQQQQFFQQQPVHIQQPMQQQQQFQNVVNSPNNDFTNDQMQPKEGQNVMMQQQQQQPMTNYQMPTQQQQAQNFFSQHHGGSVVRIYLTFYLIPWGFSEINYVRFLFRSMLIYYVTYFTYVHYTNVTS